MQPLSPADQCGNDLYKTNSPNASMVTVVRIYLHTRVCAANTTHGYYLRAALFRQSFRLCGYFSRAATIRGWRLFEGGTYSKKYGIHAPAKTTTVYVHVQCIHKDACNKNCWHDMSYMYAGSSHHHTFCNYTEKG